MHLTDKQQKYLQDICTYNNIDINEYLKTHYQTTIQKITKDIFNDFIINNTKATQKQIDYLTSLHDEPINYIKSLDIFTEKLNDLTQKQITIILDNLKRDNNIVNTKRINFDIYGYKYDKLEKDYLIGTQINNSTGNKLKVMSFFNFLVIDWDNVSLDFIKDLLKNDHCTWYIYKTHSGYHGYCMSKFWSHYKQDTLMYMQKMSCDPVYMSFVKSVGFVIRIQKKKNRNEKYIEKFVCQINDYPILPRLLKLNNIKNNVLSKD